MKFFVLTACFTSSAFAGSVAHKNVTIGTITFWPGDATFIKPEFSDLINPAGCAKTDVYYLALHGTSDAEHQLYEILKGNSNLLVDFKIGDAICYFSTPVIVGVKLYRDQPH